MSYTATDVVLIITAIGTVITSTITAFKANSSNKRLHTLKNKVDEGSEVLDAVHRQVNGNLEKAKQEAEYYSKLVEELRLKMNDREFFAAKREVDKKVAEIGGRRSSDKS